MYCATRYDKYVPAINPIMIAGKMIEYDLPFELHLFQGGEHGMSVCNNLSSYNENAKKAQRGQSQRRYVGAYVCQLD